jgi:hypothetical protein
VLLAAARTCRWTSCAVSANGAASWKKEEPAPVCAKIDLISFFVHVLMDDYFVGNGLGWMFTILVNLEENLSSP